MITLTRYTALRPARLSKKFTLREGKLHKESGGQLSEGVAERLEVAGISGLADLFKEVSGPAQALSFGINGHDRAWVVPKEALATGTATHPELPVIARDRDHIHWPEGPGIAFLDFDPADGQESLEREQLLELLYSVWPALRTGPHMWRPSASSCIVNSETDEELRGIVGQHIYANVKEPADLPRAGQVLIDRTWLAGHGWIKISASGSLLLRTPVDAMFQPERLDFAAAECVSPLVQRLPEPMIYNPDAEPIDTRTTLPDLTEAERAEVLRLQAEAKAAKAEEAAAVRARWMEARLGVMVKRNPGIPKEQLREVLQQAVEGQVLYGSFTLYDAKKQPVTVEEMLTDPDKWRGKYIRDPLEPEYSASAAWVCIDAKGAFLWSHAHGQGVRYTLFDKRVFSDEPEAEAAGDGGAPQAEGRAGAQAQAEGDGGAPPAGGLQEEALEPFRGPMADAVAAGIASATKPQPELTMLAVLTGMAACCGGHYHLPSGGRLNLYGVGVADTGGGKESPRRVGVALALAGGGTVIGRPASGQGLEDALQPYRGMLCEVDEAAHLLEALNGSHKPAYLVELSSNFLRLFSASADIYNPRVKASNRKEPQRDSIPHPCVSLLGFATPEKLGQAVGVENISEGLIGRLLFAFGSADVPPRRGTRSSLPASVVERGTEIKQKDEARRMFADSGVTEIDAEGKPVGAGVEIRVDEAAEALLWKLQIQFDAGRSKSSSPFAKALLVRSYEKCERVAGVLAVWDNPTAPRITLEHVEWAARFVRASDRDVLRFCEEYLHGGQVQADAALALKLIKRALKGELVPQKVGEVAHVKQKRVPHSVVLRASKLNKKRIDDAIAYLVDLGDVVVMPKPQGVQSNGKPWPTLYTLPDVA